MESHKNQISKLENLVKLLELENAKLEDKLRREVEVIRDRRGDDGMDAIIRQKELELSDLKTRRRSQSPADDLEVLRMKIQQAKQSDIDSTYNRLRSSIEHFPRTPEKPLSQPMQYLIGKGHEGVIEKLAQQHALNSSHNNAFGKLKM